MRHIRKKRNELANVGKCWQMLANVGKCWQMLEVSRLGVGAVRGLERDAWSMVPGML